MTGEAATTVGASGQGMVSGDLVNSAAAPAAAEPGSVLVDDATRASTEASIAFEAAGAQALKGKRDALAAGGPSVSCRARRSGSVRWARAAVRWSVGRAAPPQGARPSHWPGVQGPTGLDHGRRRHRQEPAGLGARQAHRRHRRGHLLAPWTLARVRRGRRVLGARRDGPAACGSPRPTVRTSHANGLRPRWTTWYAIRRSVAGSARGWLGCSGSRARPRPNGRISSPPGGRSSNG